jgi:hypothetical protein
MLQQSKRRADLLEASLSQSLRVILKLTELVEQQKRPNRMNYSFLE